MAGPPTCPVCDSPAGEPFAEFRGVPVYCNVLWPTREEAVAADRADVVLHFCGECGMTWNAAFDPARVRYSARYENSLHFSEVFQRYAERLAERLVERYDLRGKDIIEIGSGKGEFLTLLCAGGRNRGFGFDPSYDGEADGRVDGSVRFVRDLYSEAYADEDADFVCSRHVLEHVDEPSPFLAGLRRTLGDRADIAVYFEVPAAEFVLGATSLWDVIYEHRSIFSTPALRRLFEDASFRVLDMGRSFGGQYLWIEAVPAPSPPRSERDERALAELGSLAQAFGRRLEASLERWRRELERHRSRGPVALWGAGSKGVTFLNLVGSEAVSSVVDVNPRKQRMHVAGTGHRVEPPAHLVDARPDVVVLLNPVYAAEVTQMLRAHSLRPLVLTP